MKNIQLVYFISFFYLMLYAVEKQHKFVIIADPELSTDQEKADRLHNAVEYINENAESKDIRFVVIIGDIGWKSNGIKKANEILKKCKVPWIPIFGDNEFESGVEEVFCDVFRYQFKNLSSKLPNFKASENIESSTYYTNFSWEIDNVLYMTADWCTRSSDEEGANVNTKTLKWLKKRLSSNKTTYNGKKLYENVVIFQHHPIIKPINIPTWFCYAIGPLLGLGVTIAKYVLADKFLFSVSEANEVIDVMEDYGDYISKVFVGHGHVNYNFSHRHGFNCIMTESLHDPEYPDINFLNEKYSSSYPTIRLVTTILDAVQTIRTHQVIIKHGYTYVNVLGQTITVPDETEIIQEISLHYLVTFSSKLIDIKDSYLPTAIKNEQFLINEF